MMSGTRWVERGLIALLLLAGIWWAWQPVREIGAGLLVLSAQDAADRGDPATALAHLDLAHGLAPNLPQPMALADYLVAARLPFDQGRAPLPLEDGGTDPYAPALNNRAVWAADRLSPAQLAQAFQQAADLGMPQAAVQFNLGVAAWQSGDLALAQEALSRAALLDPSWDRPPLFLATLLLTSDPAQPAAAEAAARQAVALSPHVRAGHLALIHALWSQGRVDDGLAAVTAAHTRFAQDAQLGLYHGLFLRAAGDNRAALDVLRSAFFAADDQSLRRRIAEEILSVL